MNEFRNSRKDRFVAEIVQSSIDAEDDLLTTRCKFNFSYFDVQEASQSFEDWDKDQLAKLLAKLKDYSKESLNHWRNKPIGGSGTVLAIYGAFPKRTDFTHPKHVPHQALWGRFRLESAVRLVGFVLPDEYRGKYHKGTGAAYDCNTFYVVFLDAHHRFYKTEKR